MVQTVDRVQAIVWRDDRLRLLDQRRLPEHVDYLECSDADDVAAAITDMVVRGAPAIGIAAAYGVVLGARKAYAASPERWHERLRPKLLELAGARPTAVNLRWALERMSGLAMGLSGDPGAALLAEARAIHAEDIAANRTMGELGAACIAAGSGVLTHCNTGSLATGGFGTALGVIRTAHAQNRLAAVYAAETRPWLQGARLTAWELAEDGIAVQLIADGAAAHLCRREHIAWIVVGADRIAANGDVANKIGTYALALAARYHGAKFMVVAPTATIDRSIADGTQIPLERRAGDELLALDGKRLAPPGVDAWNPVFDVTPADLVSVLVTEKGVVEAPDRDAIAALFES